MIAALLRIVLLSNLTLSIDEASNAYDAYSIAETLRDQHGKFLPAFLEGIGGDARESLYILLSVPFIKVWGLNEFSARLPAAVIGIITVFVIYKLINECFDRNTALIGALFLAISPWHIHFSRIAFRAILMPLLFCLGLFFFFKSFQKNNYLIISAFFFGVSLWTYSAARVFITLFLFCLVILFWQHLQANKKITLISICIFCIILIPISIFWISPEGLARAKAVGVETNPVQLIGNYLSYFSPKFLFIRGDTFLRHGPWKIGQLQYVEIITLPVGIFYLFREHNKKTIILFIWLILYPIPAALTAPSHALRAIIGSVLFPIFSAYGTEKIIKMSKINNKSSNSIIIFSMTISIIMFSRLYFLKYPKYTYKVWNRDLVEAINYVENSQYDCILMNYKQYIPAYILILFYIQYSPQKYHLLPQIKTDSVSWQIDKYKIIYLPNLEKIEKKCLFIAQPKETKLISNKGYTVKLLHAIGNYQDNKSYEIIEISPINIVNQ